MATLELDPSEIDAVVECALAEDIGDGDLTTRATVPPHTTLKTVIVARQDLVVAGMPVVVEIFRRLAPTARLEILAGDASRVTAGGLIARIEGPAEGLLTAERTALNILQLLSGIATVTSRYVAQLDGLDCKLLDTRKTLPGLRAVSKYAVRCGGGTNHRMRLDDGVLIKDNHIAVAGGVGEAVRRAKAAGLTEVRAECDTLAQVKEALAAGADSLLLDNMPPELLRQAVAIVAGRIALEASGGVTLETIRSIAETGVDFVSVGAITQSAPAIDIGLDLDTDRSVR